MATFDAGGTALRLLTSAPPVDPEPDHAPTLSHAPAITGLAEVGQILSNDGGLWSSKPEASIQRRFQFRSPNGVWGNPSGWTVDGQLAVTETMIGQEIRPNSRASNAAFPTWTAPQIGPSVGPVPAPAGFRIASGSTGRVLFAGHSLLQTSWGGETVDGHHGGILYSDWPGTTLSDFVGYGSARQVWDLNGHARNSQYDQIIVTDLTLDFTNGYPAMDSARGIETLQTLYWFGLQAQARGAELILYQHWATAQAPLTRNLDETDAYCADWLEAHLGIRVFIIPASRFVARMLAAYPAAEVYRPDGIHLSDTDFRFARATSCLVYSFLTKARCPFVRPGEEDLDQMAWEVLQDTRRAGFGGTTGYDVPEIADPLPNPAAP